MKKYRVTVNGTVYEVELEEITGVVPAAPAAAPAAPAAPGRPVGRRLGHRVGDAARSVGRRDGLPWPVGRLVGHEPGHGRPGAHDALRASTSSRAATRIAARAPGVIEPACFTVVNHFSAWVQKSCHCASTSARSPCPSSAA